MAVELEIQRIRVRYGPLEALHGVSLGIPAERVTAVLGRGGSGKTTLLRALAGTLPLAGGRVLWRGEDISRLSTYQRSVRGMTLIPDGRAVFPGLTVRDNLRLFASGRDIAPATRMFPELEARLGRRAGTLSGGEQQMLALSRALVRPSRVVLLDELSRGLAPQVVGRLYAAVGELAASGRTVVIVEQYLGEALRRADVVYTLRRGEVVFAGEPAELSAENRGGSIT